MQSPSRLGPDGGHGIMVHGLQGHGNNNQRVEFKSHTSLSVKEKAKGQRTSTKDTDVR